MYSINSEFRGRRLGESHGFDQRSDKTDGRVPGARLRHVSPNSRSLRSSVLSAEGRRRGLAEDLRPSRVHVRHFGRRWCLHVGPESVVSPETGFPSYRGDPLRTLGRQRQGRLRRDRQGELLGRFHGIANVSRGVAERAWRREITQPCTVRRCINTAYRMTAVSFPTTITRECLVKIKWKIRSFALRDDISILKNASLFQ